ncbi:MAG: ABC transporter ATP-binding protein [Rhodomicrobium sp.]|nr:ABC transporter ATP-binding protein [Rhodomicrobium sp.]
MTLAFIIAMMIYLSPSLTLALFVVTPLMLLVTLSFRRKARESYRQVRTAVARMNAFLQEHFSGVGVVQLFHHERRSSQEFDGINAEHREAQRAELLDRHTDGEQRERGVLAVGGLPGVPVRLAALEPRPAVERGPVLRLESDAGAVALDCDRSLAHGDAIARRRPALIVAIKRIS